MPPPPIAAVRRRLDGDRGGDPADPMGRGIVSKLSGSCARPTVIGELEASARQRCLHYRGRSPGGEHVRRFPARDD